MYLVDALNSSRMILVATMGLASRMFSLNDFSGLLGVTILFLH